MPFLGPIVADIDTTTATLVEPLVYQGKTDTFTIPAGRTTDFASVPRNLTWLFPKMGTWTKASVLHDDLCDRIEAGDLRVSPIDADGLFRRVMREDGTPLVARWLAWTAVRWGALANPARRPGWLRDAPAVVGISLLALPFVLLPGLLTGLVVLLDNAVERFR